jgi:DNA-binding NarL/FixJ family response regulator
MGKKKNRAAVELGRKGGKASAEKLTEEQRKQKARNAAQAKWAKKKVQPTVNWLMRSMASRRQQARRLTKREREVAEYAARGRSNRYIADQLRISPNTVKKYVSQALEKLAASNRTELACLLMNDRNDSNEPTPRLDNDLVGAMLEAAKEAHETAQYLLTRSRPTSRPR